MNTKWYFRIFCSILVLCPSNVEFCSVLFSSFSQRNTSLCLISFPSPSPPPLSSCDDCALCITHDVLVYKLSTQRFIDITVLPSRQRESLLQHVRQKWLWMSVCPTVCSFVSLVFVTWTSLSRHIESRGCSIEDGCAKMFDIEETEGWRKERWKVVPWRDRSRRK